MCCCQLVRDLRYCVYVRLKLGNQSKEETSVENNNNIQHSIKYKHIINT